MICERIDLRLIAPQPWKDGAGMTREIAVGGADAENFDWRISVAALTGDAPFSAYPGIDRCITLLHGAGMARPLRCDRARAHRLHESVELRQVPVDIGALQCLGRHAIERTPTASRVARVVALIVPS